MNERVGLLPGVDRDREGRSRAIVASWRSSVLATITSLLAMVQAAAQEQPVAPKTVEKPNVLFLSEADLRPHFRNIMHRLGANQFSTRQEATQELQKDTTLLLQRMSPLPADIQQILSVGDREQRSRSEGIVARANEITEQQEARLGIDGIYPMKELISRWERHLGRSIPVEKSLLRHAQTPIAVTKADTFTMTIATICRTIRAVPTESGGFEPAPPNTIVTATSRLLGIVHTAESGTRTMDVRFEPGSGTIVRSQLVHESRTWKDGIPPFTVLPTENVPTGFRAGVGYAPQSITVALDTSQTFGFQTMSAFSYQRGMTWETIVTVKKRESLEPITTPDGGAVQAICRTTSCTLVDARGNALPVLRNTIDPEIEEWNVTQINHQTGQLDHIETQMRPARTGQTTLSFTTSSKPVAIRFNNIFPKYNEQYFDLPPFTPPTDSSQ